MKTYLWVTGTVFGLLTVVHIWRMVIESMAPAREPWFLLITAVSLALCLWAFGLLRSSASRS
jgi:uncharacterized membrane protein